MSTTPSIPDDYPSVLAELKERVHDARLHARRSVNTALIELYWAIGRILSQRQANGTWGSGILTRMATDLRKEFPEMRGLSPSNLKYMRQFAQAWPESSIGQQAVGQLPWGHITVLLDKLPDREQRDWYALEAARAGWSRAVLTQQIMNRVRDRTGVSVNNFATSLTRRDSELAHALARDPYVLDFLDLTGTVLERDIENAMMDRLVDTLRELGAGFAFVGRQVHFDVDGDDFYLDLLFFHVEQLRYVVIELKTGRFQPEHAGKLGFYVSLVNDRLRRRAHKRTVGILLCTTGNDSTVRYALGGSTAPMAVSTYTYDSLPTAEKLSLPPAALLMDAITRPHPT